MVEFTVLNCDVLVGLKSLPSDSVDCVFTSPPYWGLRDYGKNGQIGLEETPQVFVNKLVNIFDEVKRVLKPSGTCFVNIGDTYYTKSGSNFENDNLNPMSVEELSKGSGINKANQVRGNGFLPDKSLCNVPARFSIGMQDRGWILRNEIVWFKSSCMPSSVKDRFTVDFEKVFFFVKEKEYFFEQQLEPVKEVSINRVKYGHKSLGGSPYSKQVDGDDMKRFCNSNGRNMRCVWNINPKPYREAHFACFPPALVERGLKAGCPVGGVVLDPFVGSGTTLQVARDLGMNGIGIELNENYLPLIEKRLTTNGKGIYLIDKPKLSFVKV